MRGLFLALLIASASVHGEYPPARARSANPSSDSRGRAPASASAAVPAPSPSKPAPPPTPALGVRIGGNGNFAKVANEDTTNGFGYSVALPVYVPLSTRFRLSIAPGVQVLSLTRTVDGTGQLIDPNPAEFTQTIRFFSLGALLGFQISQLAGVSTSAGRTDFWIESGFDFLYPFSAVQSDSFGGEDRFSATGKLLFAVLGVSGEYRLDARFGLGCDIQAGYNLFARSGSQLLTTRFSLDAVFHL